MTEDRILRTLRAQAWERAKAELRSVLQTFWDGPDNAEKFNSMDKAVEDFVKLVEDNGLTE